MFTGLKNFPIFFITISGLLIFCFVLTFAKITIFCKMICFYAILAFEIITRLLITRLVALLTLLIIFSIVSIIGPSVIILFFLLLDILGYKTKSKNLFYYYIEQSCFDLFDALKGFFKFLAYSTYLII